tara:strand:+ start:747 stop:3137 length:2391 start_codon:yes stop_codon:yes gene_type:complete
MKQLLLLLIILPPIISFSQEKNKTTFTISGKIVDAATKKPLEDATVIFKSIDSNTIKCGGITNARGNFSIDVEKGIYNASVKYISYKEKKINIATINRDLNIGTVELETDTEYLDAIEIISEKKTIEFKRNKQVYNVAKDLSSGGATATEILSNIPSVSVDPEGNIKLRGQSNVGVMIDGKTSSLTKGEALKSLPAGSIENIIVITNPGASYKASYAGVINIILKKGKDIGLNGSITATGGYKDYYGGLLTLNNKTKKINFFTNASYFHRNPVTMASYENEYFLNGTTTSFLNENTETNSNDKGIYSTIGVEFYLSDKTFLTSKFDYTNINNKSKTDAKSYFFDSNRLPTSFNNRNFNRNLDDEIYEVSLDFEHNFNKEGQQLIASIIYTNDEELYINNSTNTNSSFLSESYTENNILETTNIDAKFVNPIKETSTLTLGYYGEFSNIPFTYEGISPYSNILFKSKTNAAFVSFENQGEKFYYELGLRGEQTNFDINYETTTINNTKDFNNLFPSVYLEYNFNDSKNLSFNYSKKIFSPGYFELMPYEQKFSATNSYIGNENLNPFYVDKLNLTYMYSKNKLTISSSLFYDYYKDWMEIVTYETGETIDGVNKLITTIDNVGNVDYYGLDFTTSYKPNNIINFTSNIFVLYLNQNGIFETINNANQLILKDYNQTTFTTYFSLLTQIKIPNLFDIQTNIKHDIISEGRFYTRRPRTYANLAINKDLFNKDASISLTIDDIFLSNKTDRDRFDENYFSKTLSKNKYRTVLLSFTYRFNQSKKDRRIDFDKKEIKPNY